MYRMDPGAGTSCCGGMGLAGLGIRGKVVGVGASLAAARLWTTTQRRGEGEELPTREVEGERRAVVVGGGVAGVTTAYQLVRRGFHVTLLEGSSRPGAHCSAVAAGGMQRSQPTCFSITQNREGGTL